MIQIYTTSWCPYCRMTKQLLKKQALKFKEIDIEKQGLSRDDLERLTGGRTVPQIVINGSNIGGYENLLALAQAGKLNTGENRKGQ